MSEKWPVRGILCVISGFIVNLMFGSWYTFGNTMPYMVSYMRESTGEDITYADFASIQLVYGIFNSISFLLAAILTPFIGAKAVLYIGCFLFAIGPILTRVSLDVNLGLVIFCAGFIQGIGTLALMPVWTVPMT